MMQEWIEFIKSLIRPFIVCWGFIVYSLCIINRLPIPEILSWLVAMSIIEYFGERAILRFKENLGNKTEKGE